ncbi:fatty acid desaturase family protein [Hymenobacter sp. BRD67]|uniref:fatty acid desaturase family protein n=1 Tax=Hymenobacter sp. BRD67 TaxID=2675877 RepID=UPI0015657A83|nr:fatty acid desaturase [Hymenobacter sp. BRD67]QKG53512.1 fatty acid desaturase [Hymenobacter sp. BRD67]
MKVLAASTDPVNSRPEAPTHLDSFLGHYLQDERDLPFVYLSLKISATMLPLAVLLFVPALRGAAWWAVFGVFFFLSNAVFKGPFGLMLHCTSHRVLFKKKYSVLNKYIPWVIGPLFGQTPETYFTHHMGMHHPENNLPDDESSTMFYQRDSLRGFLHYLTDFLVLGIPRLVGYFNRRHRPVLRFRLLRGELIYIIFSILMACVNLPATLAVFVVPLVLSRVIMMLGNWAQHAFIAADSPENCYRNSVTCINTTYNHKCWNDGYHISHHLKPAMHWTEHPQHFRQNLGLYASNDAIVFDGIHFLHIFFYLMGKRYDLLARHFVLLDGTARTETEVIDLLRSRTQRIGREVLVPQLL